MIGKALQLYAEDLGFTVSNDCAYGIYQGYLVTLYDSLNHKTLFINYYLSDEDENDSQKSFNLSEFIKNIIEEYSINDYEVDVNGVSITTKEGLVKYSELLKLLVEKLSEMGICGSNKCSECGKEIIDGKLKKVSVDLNRYGLCEDCTVAFLQATEDQKETNQDNGSTQSIKSNGKGWLANLIIILGGTILWTLLCMFKVFGDNNNLIVGVIMSLLLPVIHVRLYDLFDGEKGNKRIINVCIVIAIVAIISNYIGSIGSAYSEMGITDINTILISLKYALIEPLEISDSFFSIPFYKNTIVSLLVSFIGIVLFVTDFLKPKEQSHNDIKID